MWTYIELLEKNNKKVIYQFGIEKLDGIMEVDLEDINKSKIVCMPSDGLVNRRLANNAFGHILSLSRKGEFPEKKMYANG